MYSAGGERIPFEFTAADLGYLATEDPKLIGELEACIAGQRGGVLRSSESEFADFQKKKLDSPLSEQASNTVASAESTPMRNQPYREEIAPPMLPDTVVAAAPSTVENSVPSVPASEAVTSSDRKGRGSKPPAIGKRPVAGD